MGFIENARLKQVPIQNMVRPTGGGTTSVELPHAGILQGIAIPIAASVAGTLSAPNALGLASIIKRIALQVNAGHRIFDLSGGGYFYLLAEMLEDNYNFQSYSEARLAVTTGAKNLDIYIPVAQNSRDELGLFMLQSDATVCTLSIDWEADATVATGATVTATASPHLYTFEVPSNPADLPQLDVLHQCVEEQVAISAAGDFDHYIQRGGVLIGEYYLMPAGFTAAELRVQSTNIVERMASAAAHRMRFMRTTSRDANMTGTAITGFDKRLFFDLSGSDGLGQYGSVRDVLNTNALTNVFSRITAVGATTLYAIRRQLVPLAG